MLERNRWQRGVTAEVLGVDRRTIRRKVQRYRQDGFLAETSSEE